MAPQCDLVLVIGSQSSSNSNRLREVAEKMGCEARLIGSAAQLDPSWVTGRHRIGVTAGASAPEVRHGSGGATARAGRGAREHAARRGRKSDVSAAPRAQREVSLSIVRHSSGVTGVMDSRLPRRRTCMSASAGSARI